MIESGLFISQYEIRQTITKVELELDSTPDDRELVRLKKSLLQSLDDLRTHPIASMYISCFGVRVDEGDYLVPKEAGTSKENIFVEQRSKLC